MKVEAATLEVRNRLPGLEPAQCIEAIADLGQLVARAIELVHVGEPLEGRLGVDDLTALGMDDAYAAALVPTPGAECTYADAWRALGELRVATRALAAPRVVAALPKLEPGPVVAGEALGALTELLFGPHFVSLDRAEQEIPGAREALEDTLGALARERHLKRAWAELAEAGWIPVEDSGAVSVHVHPSAPVLVVVGAEEPQDRIQAGLARLDDLLGTLGDAARAAGIEPVQAAQQVWDRGRLTWFLDGMIQPADSALDDLLPRGGAEHTELVRSLAGLGHARMLGIDPPAWAECPRCTSPRVDVARFELHTGRTRLEVLSTDGDFASSQGVGLGVVDREPGSVRTLARLLRCVDCGTAWPFPGAQPPTADAIPLRMAGTDVGSAVEGLLAWWVQEPSVLEHAPLPLGIEADLAGSREGAQLRVPDQQLVLQAAYRLPDSLVDLSRAGAGPDAFHEAAARLRRDAGVVVSWELVDPRVHSAGEHCVVALGVDAARVANHLDAWLGPVPRWVQVAPGCWRGMPAGAGGRLELIVLEDALGAPGAFDGDSADFELAERLLRGSGAVVYLAGDVECDDEGLQWAVEEGKLAVVYGTPEQLAWAPDDISRVDCSDPDAGAAVRDAIADAATHLVASEIRALAEARQRLEAALPPGGMTPILRTPDLLGRALEALRSGRSEAWVDVVDHLLTALQREAGPPVRASLRPALAARRMRELKLPRRAVEGLWNLLEFAERTRVVSPLLEWLQPALRDPPDRVHLARIRAVTARMPDVAERYTELRALRDASGVAHPTELADATLGFWLGIAAPAYATAEPAALPDLLGRAGVPSGRPIVVAGPHLTQARLVARLLGGLDIVEEASIPAAGWGATALVRDPAATDAHRVAARGRAGSPTILLTEADPSRWAEALPHELVATAVLHPEDERRPPLPEHVRAWLPGLGSGVEEELALLMYSTELSAGTTLVRAGAAIGSLARIRTGAVAIDGRRLGPGSLIGGEQLVGRGPAHVEVEVVEDGILDAIGHSAYDALVELHPRVAALIERSVLAQLEQGVASPTDEEADAMYEELGAVEVAEMLRLGQEWSTLWRSMDGPPFDRLDENDARALFEDVRASSLSRGEVLFDVGDSIEVQYLVLSGGLMELTPGHGRPIRVGQLVGDLPRTGAPMAFRCGAADDTTLLVVGRAEVERLLAHEDRTYRLALLTALTRDVPGWSSKR